MILKKMSKYSTVQNSIANAMPIHHIEQQQQQNTRKKQQENGYHTAISTV